MSITNRYVTTRTSPVLYAFIAYLVVGVGFAFLLRRRGTAVPIGDPFERNGLVLGGLTALRTTVVYVAFSLAPAARISVVLLFSIPLTVVAGSVLFGEDCLERELAGATLVHTGAALAV